MWAIVAVLFIGPVLAAFWGALASPDPFRGLVALAMSPEVRRVLAFTASEALASSVLSLVAALPAAFLLYVGPGRRSGLASVVRNAVIAPFVMPGVLVVLSMMVLYGRNGYVSQLLRAFPGWGMGDGLAFLYGFWGIVLVHVFYNVSIGVRMVGVAWERLDTRVTDASRTLGASPWRSLLTISFPLLAPALWYSFFLTFVYSALSFTPVMVFGGGLLKTVEVAIYTELNAKLDFVRASQLALLQTLLLSCLVAIGIAARHIAGRYAGSFACPVSHGTPSSRMTLLGHGYLWLLAVFAIGPLAALAARSLGSPVSGGPRTHAYTSILAGQDLGTLGVSAYQVASTSLAIAAATALITLGLAYAAAVSVPRRGSRTTLAVRELVLLLPLTVSPLSMGLGSMRLMSGLPPVLGLVFFQVLLAFPVVYSVIQVGVDSLEGSLVEAARILGARGAAITRTIRLPLLRGSIVAALSYGFAISMGDFAGVLLMGRGQVVTFPVAIYRLMGHYNFAQATALGVLLGLLTTGLFLIADNYSSPRRGGGADASTRPGY